MLRGSSSSSCAGQALENDAGSSTCLSNCGAFMEPCPTPSCAMGRAGEATGQAGGCASHTLCTGPCSRNPCWEEHNDVAVAVPAPARGECLSGSDAGAAAAPVEPQSPSSKKSSLENAEGERPPKQLKRQGEEMGPPEGIGELCTSLDSVHPEEGPAAATPVQKRTRRRKPRKKTAVRRGPLPKAPRPTAGDTGPSENSLSLPVKVPKKRGRKSKAELLLMKLSQGLDCQSPEPVCPQKPLPSDETLDHLETTSGGRPKRRAAKA